MIKQILLVSFFIFFSNLRLFAVNQLCNECDFPAAELTQEVYVDKDCQFTLFYTSGECENQCFIRIDSLLLPKNGMCSGYRPNFLINKVTKIILENFLEKTPCFVQSDTMRIVNLYKSGCMRIEDEHIVKPCQFSGCCMTKYICNREKGTDRWNATAALIQMKGFCEDPEYQYNCFYTCE